MISAVRDMTILEEDFKQRASDGKWQHWVKIMDTDNMYSYTNETGSRVTLIPECWMVIGVYDYLMEIVD